ncbi:hypothetical protein EU538_12840 [Candidatus Thorarchaeota archaeon]|nr:MAG: hypothetical protein EU538_12840 [Candidatus Thorarchaeota archaeon]
MIPNEVLLWVLLLTLGGELAGVVIAIIMTAYLRWEMFGGKWALLMIVWSVGLAYALPILYVWTIDTSYVQELVTDYPALFLEVGIAMVVLPLLMWMSFELAKRRQPGMEEEAE